MPLALACELCPLVLQVPEGVSIKAPPLCPSCAEGTMVVVEAQQDPEEATPSEPPTFEFLPQPIAPDKVKGFIDELFPGVDADESKMLSNRINRLAPLVLAIQVVAELKSRGATIDEASVIETFGSVGRQYRKELRKLEDQEGIGRGLRLSDGFPKDTDDHLRLWTRLFIGGDPNDLRIDERGLAQQLGLMGIIDGEERIVVLGHRSEVFLPIDLPQGPNIEIEDIPLPDGVRTVRMPQWIRPSDVDAILGFITQVADAETDWMKSVLRSVEGYVAVTTSDICDREVRSVMFGKRPPDRWLDRSGEPVLLRSKREGELEGLSGDALEEHQAEALDSKIRPTVISTLGRLKELGLVYPFKRGRSTVYKATKHGHKWIKDWDKVPDR